MTIEDAERLERDLRHLLVPVELVCEADIPQDLIDAAEGVTLPLLKSEQYGVGSPGTELEFAL